MIYTQQLKQLLNELGLAEGRNCLLFVILDKSPNELIEVIESNGFKVNEIYLRGELNLLEILTGWGKTAESSIYFVSGIFNQFPWVLGYLNLHRDLFYNIKRPVIIVGSEYEISEIAKLAPDFFRFRSRTYDLTKKKVREREEGFTMSLAKPEPVYYSLPIFEEEIEEEKLKERIKVDEYLLGTVRDDYKRAELYMSLALSQFKLDDFKKGSEYFEKSNAIRAKLSDQRGIFINYKRIADVLLWKGRFEAAMEHYNQVLKLNPNLAEAYLSRGVAYHKLNQHERAIRDYNKAIELNPGLAAAYLSRGAVYADKKEFDRAIEDFNKGVDLNPNFALAYNGRGTVYIEKKEFDKATEDFNKEIELGSFFEEGAYLNRGIAYMDKGEFDKAIEDLNKAIALDSEYAKAYSSRGSAYAEKGKSDRAIVDYNKAIELNPKLAEAYNNRGVAYRNMGKLDKAIQDYDTAIELEPDDDGVAGVAYTNRGVAYEKKGEFDRAIQDHNKAIELNPKDVKAYLNRGSAYADKGEFDKAIEDYDKAIELNPSFADAYNNRGLTYKNKGEFDKA
ncbi:Tetratricopeptide (TPR) repeat containing protein, partial [Candidatus Methanophagaceae archaeon]